MYFQQVKLIASILTIFFVLLISTTSLASPPRSYKVEILADEVTQTGNTVIVTVKGYAVPLSNAIISLELPQIGPLEPESVVLWRGSTAGPEKFEYEYTVSGLKKGRYELIAKFSEIREGTNQPFTYAAGHLYIKATEHGIFCSRASMASAYRIEVREEIKRRGFSNLSDKELRVAAPDLHKRSLRLREGNVALPDDSYEERKKHEVHLGKANYSGRHLEKPSKSPPWPGSENGYLPGYLPPGRNDIDSLNSDSIKQ